MLGVGKTLLSKGDSITAGDISSLSVYGIGEADLNDVKADAVAMKAQGVSADLFAKSNELN